jgi:hypothetical protein
MRVQHPRPDRRIRYTHPAFARCKTIASRNAAYAGLTDPLVPVHARPERARQGRKCRRSDCWGF